MTLNGSKLMPCRINCTNGVTSLLIVTLGNIAKSPDNSFFKFYFYSLNVRKTPKKSLQSDFFVINFLNK
jgi:hypothetical protein